MHEQFTSVQIVWRGIVGVSFPILGTVTSCLPDIEQWLRLVSLIIGILVGLLTLLSFLKKRKGE